MTDMEQAKTDAEFLRKAKAHAARKRQIPADMGFLPLSDKFAEDAPVKAPWLRDYLRYRQQHAGASRERLLRFLAEAGADHSELADRARGSLLGLAMGDAVGTTLECRKRDEVVVSNMVGGAVFVASGPLDRRHEHGVLPGLQPHQARRLRSSARHAKFCGLVSPWSI